MAADCWCEISAGHIIISVFREIVQEEVTRSVVIGILYDLSVEWDLLNQRGYPKRGNLARGKQVIFHEMTIGFPQNDVSDNIDNMSWPSMYKYYVALSKLVIPWGKFGSTCRESKALPR